MEELQYEHIGVRTHIRANQDDPPVLFRLALVVLFVQACLSPHAVRPSACNYNEIRS